MVIDSIGNRSSENASHGPDLEQKIFRDRTEPTLFQAGTVPVLVPALSLHITPPRHISQTWRGHFRWWKTDNLKYKWSAKHSLPIKEKAFDFVQVVAKPTTSFEVDDRFL